MAGALYTTDQQQHPQKEKQGSKDPHSLSQHRSGTILLFFQTAVAEISLTLVLKNIYLRQKNKKVSPPSPPPLYLGRPLTFSFRLDDALTILVWCRASKCDQSTFVVCWIFPPVSTTILRSTAEVWVISFFSSFLLATWDEVMRDNPASEFYWGRETIDGGKSGWECWREERDSRWKQRISPHEAHVKFMPRRNMPRHYRGTVRFAWQPARHLTRETLRHRSLSMGPRRKRRIDGSANRNDWSPLGENGAFRGMKLP